MSRADLIVRTVFLLVVIALCALDLPRPAASREFGEVRWGHASRVVRLPVDERSWLSYGPGRPAGYIGHPGVIERPAGFEFHRGAINLGGR